jgi:hypothetical protein
MARTRGLRKKKNVQTAECCSMEERLNRIVERYGTPREVEEVPVQKAIRPRDLTRKYAKHLALLISNGKPDTSYYIFFFQ